MTQAATEPTTRPAKPPLWKKVLAAYRDRPLMYGFFTLLGIILLIAAFSSLSGDTSGPGHRSGGGKEREAGIRFITESLGRLELYDGWEYTETLRDSLNEWSSRQHRPANWRPDAYAVNQVPARAQVELGYAVLKNVQVSSGSSKQPKVVQVPDPAPLATKKFSIEDARIIQGAAWMRSISDNVRQRLENQLGRNAVVPNLMLAEGLFDWTMRNIALEEGDGSTVQLPWESLLWGKARAKGRAWVFMELCRQQRPLEVVLLGYRDGSANTPAYKPWIAAVLLENELYLFDHHVGLPIPGPGGKGIATLKQAMERPEVLAQLDVESRKYPVRAADLKRGMVAYVDASPHLVSWRMRRLQEQFHSQKPLVLFASVANLESRVRAALYHAAGITPPAPVPAKDKDKTDAKQPDERVATAVWTWPLNCLRESRIVRQKEFEGLREFEEQRKSGETVTNLNLAAGFDSRLRPFDLPGFERKEEGNIDLRDFFDVGKARGGVPGSQSGQMNDPLRAALKSQLDRQKPELKTPDSLNTKLTSGFLWRGRMLQFKGIDQDERKHGAVRRQGAPNVYQSGTLSETQLDQILKDLEKDLKQVAETLQKVSKTDAEKAEELQLRGMRRAQQISEFGSFRLNRQLARAMARYWLGLVTYDRGDYADAVAYFERFRDQELKFMRNLAQEIRAELAEQAKEQKIDPREIPPNLIEILLPPWTHGSRYNLARSLEALGGDENLRKAIDLYESDASPDTRHGSLLRARRLKQKLAGEEKKAAKT